MNNPKGPWEQLPIWNDQIVLYGAPPVPDPVEPWRGAPFPQLQRPVDAALQASIERLERLLVSSTKAMHERLNAVSQSLDGIENRLKGFEVILAGKKPRKKTRKKKP